MKLLYVVLDGAAGDPSLGRTAYMVSEKPNIDLLARKGKCGMLFTIGRGIPPESDAAVLSLLGYDPDRDHPGRGPIEALGVGLSLAERREVAFRGNFATVDPSTGRILDRRAGRIFTREEAESLANSLDGITLNGGYARVRASVGHRVVVVIGSEKFDLGDEVGNTDPAYIRRGKISISASSFENKISQCIPLLGKEENRRTCELVNEFTWKAIDILDKHPVNRSRINRGLPPANAVLLRDGGGKSPVLQSLSSKFGNLQFTALVEMPVEIGIAKAAGMNVITLPPPEGKNREGEYKYRARKAVEALERSDVVYVHLKGPDEPGHDGNLELKANIIGEIDKYFFGSLVNKLEDGEIAILVTSDHATPCQLRAHSDSPVPFLLYYQGIKSDGILTFNEVECRSGSFGILERGKDLLPLILKEIGLIKSPEKGG
ncbi:MAG: alkaline phosphatase family protein [Fervidicoccaceae archaeon]